MGGRYQEASVECYSPGDAMEPELQGFPEQVQWWPHQRVMYH